MEPIILKDEIQKQNNLIFQKIKPSNREVVKTMITKYDLAHSFLKLIGDNMKDSVILFEKVKEALNTREKTLISMTTYL
jgi:cytochrome c peroxidase